MLFHHAIPFPSIATAPRSLYESEGIQEHQDKWIPVGT